MRGSLAVIFRSPLLQSISVLAVAGVASISGAHAQTANTSPSSVHVLNLLSPFLGLNSGSVGQTTLADSLAEAISVNNSASPALQDLSFSDKNWLSGSSNTLLTGPATPFGVAANLGGVSGKPAERRRARGMQLGKIYADGVNALANGDHSVLPNMVNLLTSAYGNLTSPNLGAAKNYFANGTTDGMKPAVAPAGFTLPTFNGLPNMTGSVYRLAYVPWHPNSQGLVRQSAARAGGAALRGSRSSYQLIRSDRDFGPRDQPIVPERPHDLRLYLYFDPARDDGP